MSPVLCELSLVFKGRSVLVAITLEFGMLQLILRLVQAGDFAVIEIKI